MFSGLTNILTLMTFVVHAVVGCCLHHAHESCQTDSQSYSSACDCGHHHHSTDAEQPGSDENSPSGCEGNHCWLIADRCDDETAGKSFHEFCCVPLLVSADAIVDKTIVFRADLSPAASQSLTAPQACARLGVWLI